MAEIEQLIDTFEPLGLAEIGDAALMSRMDRKFVLAVPVLPEVLRRCTGSYRVLEVSGRRFHRYRSTYFDTPDLVMYLAHHAGRAVRRKIRVRTYVDTNDRYLEYKSRTNRGLTTKLRVRLAPEDRCPLGRIGEIAGAPDPFLADLVPALTVAFTRLTLVRPAHAERVTIDTDLVFSIEGKSALLPGVAFGELKQKTRGDSPWLDAMRLLRVGSGAISKYCLGIATLHPTVRSNQFKLDLARLHRIVSDNAANANPR